MNQKIELTQLLEVLRTNVSKPVGVSVWLGDCNALLAAEKFGDSQIKSDLKLGPQTHLGAESQSEGTIQLVPILWKMVIIIPRREEEHEKEWLWQLVALNEYVEWEEG